jgi:hypothetical protein
MSVTVSIIDDNNISVAVTNDTIGVSVADTPIPLDLYQLKITISATAPVDPDLNDLWLDIS